MQQVAKLEEAAATKTNEEITVVAAPLWHLAPAGATVCDSGIGVEQAQCASAVESLGIANGVLPALNRWMGGGCDSAGWDQVPTGCSILELTDGSGPTWQARYKTAGVVCNDSVTPSAERLCNTWCRHLAMKCIHISCSGCQQCTHINPADRYRLVCSGSGSQVTSSTMEMVTKKPKWCVLLTATVAPVVDPTKTGYGADKNRNSR